MKKKVGSSSISECVRSLSLRLINVHIEETMTMHKEEGKEREEISQRRIHRNTTTLNVK